MRLNRGGTAAARPSERTQQVSSAVFGMEAKPLQTREAHAHAHGQAPSLQSRDPLHPTPRPPMGTRGVKASYRPLLPPPISKPAPDHSAQSHCSTCRGQPSAHARIGRLPKASAQTPGSTGCARLRRGHTATYCPIIGM